MISNNVSHVFALPPRTLYPRACAGGERRWSAESVTDQDAAEQRLEVQRCRLVNRGFAAGPVGPSGYCKEVHV